ncbi:DUF2891 domain-containing protein [Roseomonas sp. ACRSG]|nr:DUF2891 domain-containing protein [Roseomonas sp. ACRSG]
MTRLDETLAAKLARIALGHVTREYPNKLDHVMAGPEDARGPRDLHPIFFGSFDWHSCVHSYWMLARLLRRFPGMAPAAEIRALFDAQFTAANVEAERAYLRRPTARGFERPYGWGWLLKLAAELPPPHAETLSPLAGMMAERFLNFLPRATYPTRVGTHYNSAFAFCLAADYAAAVSHQPLAAMLRDTARRWFGEDADCQAWEPGGDDFLSSALVEAECMRRLLPEGAFLPWFGRFLPRLAQRQPATLFHPATVSDRTDGKIAHLDGLNLSRAWCWRSIAAALPEADPRRALALETAEVHLQSALPHVAGDYMGEHWLASFAVLALEA